MEKSQKKCNHCDYTLSEAGNLRRHLKKHIGEKTLDPHRAHLKIQSGEKSHKCNQCDYESSGAEVLRGHLKHTEEKSQTNAANATMHPLKQAI